FQSNWKSFRVDVIGVNFEADVAVLALQERIVASALPIEINGSGCAAGQEVFILGFPLGIVGYAVQPGYPIPLVKRGVAAMFNPGPPRSIYISASANPGFSGGPVYFANHQGKATLMAIVTAELGYEVPVKNEQGETVGKIMKDSNIVACSYIDHALTLIGDNPRGLPIA
ncbi:MAG TPA: serine protease, partial [Stellaceae bacterium]|nr:serine protease [Stellaceae bacterium]